MTHLKSLFILFTFINVTWFNAHLYCLACGGQLASSESEAEQKYLEGLTRDLGLQNARFWIAGTGLANEGIFNWFTTGNLITYSKIYQAQPDNYLGAEHCIELFQDGEQLQWNDANCNILAFFICENRPKCV